MKKYINGRCIMSIVFLIILSFFFIMNFNSLYSMAKTEVKAILCEEKRNELLMTESIESTYDSNFYRRLDFIDINGLVHRILGQKLVNGAIKADDGQLFLDSDKDYIFDSSVESEYVNSAVSILKKAQNTGATTLYVQRPHKFIEGKSSLPYGMNVEINAQYDFWLDNMQSNGIDSVDLRNTIEDNLQFYDTDHHWTVESSFCAAKSIIESLNALDSDVGLNEKLFDEKCYSVKIYSQSFLGSEGVKAGKYYVGKDDFKILLPKFKTSLEYQHYIDGKVTLKKNGDFINSFIDMEILEDDEYYNKYNACLFGGYVENIIKNSEENNGKKLLIISDSFARPMVMYLSLEFSETRYLDPQEGRYNESYIKYIEDYDPDVVVMMYTGKFKKI